MFAEDAHNAVTLVAPALPKAGEVIQGLGEQLSAVGPDGQAVLSIPLPILPGRGYAPDLQLGYGSNSGNGVWGIGWSLPQLTVARRTQQGVPLYRDDDEFTGPGGELLIPATGENAQRHGVQQAGDITLFQSYRVTRYLLRIEGPFDRIERWQGELQPHEFWLITSADGQQHLLGYSEAGRIADPQAPEHIAQWLLEESISPLGEHCRYHYVTATGQQGTRQTTAQRYLQRVDYANTTATLDPYLLTQDPDETQWLFSLCFDYGERINDPLLPPDWQAPGTRRERADAFSRYSFGFELRTLYLCRQIILFGRHPQTPTLPPTPVSRLWFDYDDNADGSVLRRAQLYAWEADGKIQVQPPLSLDYSQTGWSVESHAYQSLPAWPEVNQGHYQLVDLFGEGVPGLLYQVEGIWGYQAPIREGDAGSGEITYAPWKNLPAAPAGSISDDLHYFLMDITGDSRLDWVMIQPGITGFFSLGPGETWQKFMPFSAFPSEFFHSQRQMVDLIGNGRADIALIGPTSVRVYTNTGEGFLAAEETQHSGTPLPLPGFDARELVAWSDVLGSGQSHLVRVQANRLECWPNLGHGRFAEPLLLSQHRLDDDENFSPHRVFLVDLRGCGATDLLYAKADGLYIYLNQAGNGFSAAQRLRWPADFQLDDLRQINFADLTGQGGASLILSHRHMAPRHWRYDFIQHRGNLLAEINNNQGLRTEIDYISSAQSWLDEKQCYPTRLCQMPLTLPIVEGIYTHDEITGLISTVSLSYYGGVYDGREREWRGYRRVDSTTYSDPSDHIGHSFQEEQHSRCWYHTGQPGDELPSDDYFSADKLAFSLAGTRLTRWREQQDETIEEALPATQRQALHRALAGNLLRQEQYGRPPEAESDPTPVWVPYQVNTWRWQVRLHQEGEQPVVLPGLLESLTWNYEQRTADPACQQQVILARDDYGAITWQTLLYYPRRTVIEEVPGLTPEQWHSTEDDAQHWLWLEETQNHWHHLTQTDHWHLALPVEQSRYALTYRDSEVNLQQGLGYEELVRSDGLLGENRARHLTGWQRWRYVGGTPTRQALVSTVETALLDQQRAALYGEVFDEATLSQQLTAQGYIPHTLTDGQRIWALPSGEVQYLGVEHFFRPTTIQAAGNTSLTRYEYDPITRLLHAITDAADNRVQIGYDYRFWRPTKLVDMNENIHEVLLDALGRLVATTWYGTQEGDPHGFGQLAQFTPNWPTPLQAIEQPKAALQQMSTRLCYAPLSWMGNLNETLRLAAQGDEILFSQWQTQLQQAHCVDALGNICATGHAWAQGDRVIAGLPDMLKPLLQEAHSQPAHWLQISADELPSQTQTPRMEICYQDGAGHLFQQKRNAPAGQAYQSNQGYIVTDETGVPQQGYTETRWLTATGKLRSPGHDSATFTMAPYFVDSPEAIDDRMLILSLPTTVQYYDALGRETLQYNEKGEYQYQAITPWFRIQADKNDLLWLKMEEEEEDSKGDKAPTHQPGSAINAYHPHNANVAMHSERVDIYDRISLQEVQYYHLGNGVRTYSPWSGRFLSMDDASFSPFGEGGLNPYSFANRDPINFSDPSGHISTYALGAIGWGLLGLVLGAATFGVGAVALASLGMSVGVGALLFSGGMGIISGATGIATGVLHDDYPEAAEVLSYVSLVSGIFSMAAGLGGMKAVGALGSASQHANHARRLAYGRTPRPITTSTGVRAPRWTINPSYKATEPSLSMLTNEGRLLTTARTSRFASAPAYNSKILTPGTYFQNSGSAFTAQGDMILHIGRALGQHATVKFFAVTAGAGIGLGFSNAAYWHQYWRNVRSNTQSAIRN